MEFSVWLDKLKLAWGEGQTNLVSELFANCDAYWESPWERIAPQNIEEVWAELEGKKAKKLEFKVLSHVGECATVSWEFVNHIGRESAGVLWLRFDEKQQCRELRMWWMPREVSL
ncbi:MAG: hypothetical protein GC129_01845 [Proteobacteria bacterium]|nr:hypothetical protein [Pseudomonadota bacterium]